MGSNSPLRVGVLAYPGCFASEVFGVTDLMKMGAEVARNHGAADLPFAVTVMSPRRSVTVSGEVRIATSPVRPVDVLVVPGFDIIANVAVDDYLGTLGPELEVIAGHARSGATVVSICIGAFLLASAGVLDGRRATTSWLYAAQLRASYPAVQVDAEQLVISDSGVTTTAAFSAMYDFVLDLIERQCGRTVSRRTARVALIDDARSSQTPYVDQALLPPSGEHFSNQVQRYLDQHLADRYDLCQLADHFHVSPRTLLRRYRSETNESPLSYLQGARMRKARFLLENTDQSLSEIRATVGYRDSGSFNDLFQRHFGLRPAAYRERFHRPGI